jgi:flagella basal body P-ring formation protein FlgA
MSSTRNGSELLAAGLAWATAVVLATPLGAHASELAATSKLFLDSQLTSLPGDVEITVGDPDPRLNLAPCARYEPFIPPGARLWGRTTLGVRCTEGANWSVYLSVQIKVYGAAPVAARSIPRGQVLLADDVRMERVEWTQFPAGALASADQVEGRLATRTLIAGEPLRRDLLRTPAVVQAGDPVKLVFTGASFVIASEGKALSVASDGQAVQVAVPNGRILSGIARPGKLVELK